MESVQFSGFPAGRQTPDKRYWRRRMFCFFYTTLNPGHLSLPISHQCQDSPYLRAKVLVDVLYSGNVRVPECQGGRREHAVNILLLDWLPKKKICFFSPYGFHFHPNAQASLLIGACFAKVLRLFARFPLPAVISPRGSQSPILRGCPASVTSHGLSPQWHGKDLSPGLMDQKAADLAMSVEHGLS